MRHACFKARFKTLLIFLILILSQLNIFNAWSIDQESSLYSEGGGRLWQEYDIKDFQKKNLPLIESEIEESVDLGKIQIEKEKFESNFESQSLNKLANTRKEPIYKYRNRKLKYKYPFRDLEKIKKLAVKKMLLDQGAYIADKDENYFSIPRKVLVNAFNYIDPSGIVFFTSKDEKNVYATHGDNLHEVEDVLNFNSRPKKFKTYSFRPNYKDYDHELNVKVKHQFSVEQTQMTVVNEIIDAPKESHAMSAHLRGLLYANWRFPIKLGFGIDGQRGYIEKEGIKFADIRALYGGVGSFLNVIEKQNWTINLHGKFWRSYDFEVERNLRDFEFESILLELGTDIAYETKIGSFSFELGLNQYWLNFDNNQYPPPTGISVNENRPWGVFLGMSYVWHFML